MCHVTSPLLWFCIALSHLSWDILAFKIRCFVKSINALFSSNYIMWQHYHHWYSSHHVMHAMYHTFIIIRIMAKHATFHATCDFVDTWHYEACLTSCLRQFQLDMAHSISNPTPIKKRKRKKVALSHIVTCVQHQFHMQFCFLSCGHHEHAFQTKVRIPKPALNLNPPLCTTCIHFLLLHACMWCTMMVLGSVLVFSTYTLWFGPYLLKSWLGSRCHRHG